MLCKSHEFDPHSDHCLFAFLLTGMIAQGLFITLQIGSRVFYELIRSFWARYGSREGITPGHREPRSLVQADACTEVLLSALLPHFIYQ